MSARLLIGYDASDCADEAMDDLRRAGLPQQAEAIVLCVAEPAWPLLGGGDPLALGTGYASDFPSAALSHDLQAEALQIARRGAARLARVFPSWHITPEARTDSPAWGLVQSAEQWRPDLLVVGAHGRSIIGRVLMGSVSQAVLTHACCSVRIGRSRRPYLAPDAGVRLIVGIDSSAEATAAAECIAERHWPRGSAAMVIAATDQAPPGAMAGASPITFQTGDGPAKPGSALNTTLCSAVNAARERLADAGLHVTTLVCEADPKRLLLNQAESWGADCIFVGARGLSHIERFMLGGVSSAVAARSPCSVEVIRLPQPAHDPETALVGAGHGDPPTL